MATALNVDTLAYAPYYFFAFLSSAVLVAIAVTGKGLTAGAPKSEPEAVASDD